MRRQTRIITLLAIDTVFFLVEIIVGVSRLIYLHLLTNRVHGPLAGSGRRFFPHGNHLQNDQDANFDD